LGPSITWYDILGVLPGASMEEIQRAYDSKASLLGPEFVAGAPSKVVAAASRAQRIIDTARRVLGDPVNRQRYDEAVSIRRSGEGLVRPEDFPSEGGWRLGDFGLAGDLKVAEALAGLMALADWLAPRPRQPRRITVPDVRGLFHSVCFQIIGRLDLRVTVIQLTEHPTPVDGLVVDQSPRPPAKARRASELTVQVWHPAAR
jgi:curved DNA-binding protein CbpA